MKRTNSPDKNKKVFIRIAIVAMAIIAALALALTFALGFDGSRRISVDNAEQGEVQTSTAYTPSCSGATVNDYSGTALQNGDTFTFSTTNNYYTVKLPQGRYDLEVWGAQGGAGYSCAGGYGGYAKATYTISSATTIYVYVGGAGIKSTYNTTNAGGYNGGGSSRSQRSCSHVGGTGGGATHIATSSGLLSTLSGNTGAVLIVGGGGGGGTGYNSSASIGGSGGPSGGSATYSASYTNTAAGGTTSGGGTCTAGSTPYSTLSTAGSSGSFGAGGAGGTVSSGAGGGGGGAGYYGGAGGYTSSSCYSAPGGGGCNYIKSGLTVISNTTQSSVTGNGKAVITVINQPPTGNNYSATLGTRLSGTSTTITVDNLATDPDATKTALAFSNGTAGAYDTYSNFTTNSGLYLDAACTVSANRYFSWTTSGNTSFTIKPIKYPRAGQTGVTATSTTGNTVTLYTKIRDTYGTGTAARGCSTISFTLKVPRETITQNTAPNATVVNSAGTSSTIGCLVGNSNTTTAHGDPTAATASSIYNPNGTGVATLFVKQTLMLGGKITISAANLLSGFSTTYDQAVIAIPDVTKISGTSRLFKVTQVDNSTDKVTALSTAFGTIANTFSQISLECVTPTPGYQFLPVTVYLVEKSACNGSANVALWDSVTTQSYSFQIVFKMENTRPVLKSGVSNIVNVGVGTTTALKLGTYFSDIDNSAGITSSTHSITGVIVPKNEFIALDRLANTVALASPNNTYYNLGAKKDDAFSTSAQTTTETGFKDNIVYYTTSPGSVNQREAFMSYTYSGDTITVTGLRSSFSQYYATRANAPGHFYLMLHIKDNCDTLDNGIWLPLAFTVGNAANNSHAPVATVTTPHAVTSQAAVTTFPSAAGSVGDSFYFAPMAINYSGSHVLGYYRAEDTDRNNTGALTSANLQPLAIDGDNFATENGLASWSGNKLNELLLLSTTPETVVKSVCPANECKQISTDVWENQYFRAEYIPIYIEKSKLATSAYSGGRVVVGSGTDDYGYYFVSLADSDETDYYKVNGLKITLRSATMNRYIYAKAGVKDVTNNNISTIDIAIRVNNTALNVFKGDSGNIATFGSARDSAYSTYTYATNGDIPTFTYKIPLNGTVMVTPYDFALDYDIERCGVNAVSGGFTLNGYSGRYNSSTGMLTTGSTNAADGDRQFSGLFGNTFNANAATFLGSIKAATTVTKVSAGTAGTAASSGTNANAAVPRDRLFFERTTAGTDAYTYNPTTFNNFYNNRANTTNFVDVNFGTKVKMGSTEYAVDFVMFTALNRTTQPAVIDLAIRDRYGNGSSDVASYSTVRIIIEVVNTKPSVKNPEFYTELSVKPIGEDEENYITPNVVSLLANGNGNNKGLMMDHDSDVPEYMVSRGVAVVNKAFIDDFNANQLVDSDENSVDNLVFAAFNNLAEKYTKINGIDVTRYVTAEVISRRELTAKAISSTKAIEGGIYVVFFVTDNNGGTSLGYARIEVLNTAPVLNESDETGFNAKNPLWYIESASDADIMRNRYIVGSELAANEINSGAANALNNAALDIDIKLIAVDDDGLHNKTVLSQVSAATVNGKTEYTYNTLDMTDVTEDGLKIAVPNVVSGTSFGSNYAAVTVFTRRTSGATNEVWYTPGVPNPDDKLSVVDLYFYVDGTWYSRNSLIDALLDGTLDITSCFDESGRFIVADWALRLMSGVGFASNVDLGVNIAVRDQAELGGSTAGRKTAYHSDRNHKNESGALDNRVVVEGGLVATVYQHISKTGIHSVNEYLGVNSNYYTVEYTPNGGSTVKYVSTYDGDTTSAYSGAQDLRYDATSRKLKSDGDTVLKSRSGADNTLAGVNSGAVYKKDTAVDGAFAYSDTIEIPAAIKSGTPATGETVTYQPVYVPMSYFGSLSSLVGRLDSGEVSYYKDEFVGYDIDGKIDSDGNDLIDISKVLNSMTLSDGTYEWSGANITKNPYINIGTFDWYHDNDEATNSLTLLNDKYSLPYYNNRLAVLTVNPSNDTLLGYEKIEANCNSFVGDGRLMYLEEQATKLIEHNFGLVFSKKNVRTSTRSLTLRIDLVRYSGNKVAKNGENQIEDKDRCTAEIKIHVENTKFDLYNAEDNSSTVKYDTDKGTYYVDLTLPSSGAASYTLNRKATKSQAASTDSTVIEYYDDDYGTEEKRDYAYFSGDSFIRLSQWQTREVGYNRALQLTGTDDNKKFANVIETDKAQSSVANYFGGMANVANVDSSYIANGGIYGVFGREGYSGYFNASVTEGGAKLNIMPIRKTFINDIAFDRVTELKTVDKTSQTAVAAAYAKRGLVALYNDANVDALKPSRVYYPFKVLIYDSFGVGFTDASYVAMEFRITITNGDPTLKSVGEENEDGRQYTMNLAVNNSASINLYDIIYDSDIFTYEVGVGVGRLATEQDFKGDNDEINDLARETGDYLDSPLKHDEYKDSYEAKNISAYSDSEKTVYYRNGGGFVSENSNDYSERDVVMWMTTDTNGNPSSNIIMFKVNRRTTAVYNDKRVSINQYRFTLRFYDGAGSCTAPFTFIINIANQAPSITQVDRSFTMRKGDDMTLLTSYYDVFTDNNSMAYQNSETVKLFDANHNDYGYGISYGDGQNNATGSGAYWKFSDITTANAGEGENEYSGDGKLHHDSTTNNTGKPVHLGYVGLANDDTPWRLRITDWTKTSDRYDVSRCRLALRPESGTSTSSAYQIAIVVTARAACVNEPLTVTISDGEGGIITCTLYITIVSSPPVARDYGNTATDRPALEAIGLEGVSDGHGGYESGEFMTFIVPAEGTITFDDIDGFVGINKKARRVTTVTMSGVASDPDGRDETEAMRLYGNGEFHLGDSPLVCGSDGIYRTEFFNIQPSNDGRSFNIIATGYSPNTTKGYELLSFRIADYGDSAYENTKVIKLRIYTMYSDMTNASVASLNADAYNKYLAGSGVVNVKAYDTYFDPANPVDVSRYAFIDLEGNVGNDGNDKSPIVDPDAKVKGDATYSARLYAFVNVENGVVKALPAKDIDAMLTRDGDSKTFCLKAGGDYDKYMIGGIVDGSSIELTIQDGINRLNAILKYASFEFSADGTALLFTPNASTLESPEILLYVEAEKPGSNRTSYKRNNAVLKAGSLFRLNVLDSAPQEVGGMHAAEGRKGDVAKFTVFDPDDRYGALFMDSDNGDKVTVCGIGSDGKLSDAEYNNVMRVAEDQLPGLDWKADAETKKPRAFDISVGESGELEIKINRRVDYVEAGEYQSSVTIPLNISGVDMVGKKVSTIVYITVNNTDPTAVEFFEKYDQTTLVGYSFGLGSDGIYSMNVKLRYGVPLEVMLSDILKDNDSVGAQYDADSYRFVNPITGLAGGYKYITDRDVNVDWYMLDGDGNPNVDYTETLAVAEPVGVNDMHRTGIRFNAVATKRDLTATVYVRIIDRAGNADIEDNGIIIKINVMVMNDAPYTISGMETTTLYMVGSESTTPEGMLFFIGDFVADKNESDVVGDEKSVDNIDTCLRISLQESRDIKQIYSPSFEKLPDGLGFTDKVYSSALFEVTIPTTLDDALLEGYRKRMNKGADFYKDTTNAYNQWFVVRPRKGFYGEGAVDITVVDGNANVKYDTLSTTFCLEVHVISNPDEVIDGMTDVEIACSKTKQIDIRSLMPDMENKLKIDLVDDNQTAVDNGGVQASADEVSTFNQYEYYEIVSMGFQNEIDENKATFTKLDEKGQLWELKAGNQTTRDPVRVAVDFALKYDKTRTYRKYFYLNIIANRSPKIKFSDIEFKRHNQGESDSLSDLNEANSIRLEPWQLCEDADDPEGTAIKFVDVKSQVSSIVKAQLIKDENGEYRYLELTFVARGESEITLTVTDETGAPVQLKFMATNTDLPEASMWVKIAASFEANPVMWIIIICCALLLIVILIIIIAVVRKRKRAREELEALLVSEMEIEEQMLRLAGGPSPTNYQSYGYLQGAPAQPDPSMMLGAGADAPQPQLTALPPAQEGGNTPNIEGGDDGSDAAM